MAQDNQDRRPCRIDKRQVAAWFPREVMIEINKICAERDITKQKLLAEAINDILESHGRERMADEAMIRRAS